MWEAFQDGEKLGTGENLAPWHPIKPGGVLILGQEQVGAGRCKMGALLGCQEQRLVIQEARGPACRLSPPGPVQLPACWSWLLPHEGRAGAMSCTPWQGPGWCGGFGKYPRAEPVSQVSRDIPGVTGSGSKSWAVSPDVWPLLATVLTQDAGHWLVLASSRSCQLRSHP